MEGKSTYHHLLQQYKDIQNEATKLQTLATDCYHALQDAFAAYLGCPRHHIEEVEVELDEESERAPLGMVLTPSGLKFCMRVTVGGSFLLVHGTISPRAGGACQITLPRTLQKDGEPFVQEEYFDVRPDERDSFDKACARIEEELKSSLLTENLQARLVAASK